MAAGEGNDVSASITIQTRSRDAELDALAQKYDKLKKELEGVKNKSTEAAAATSGLGDGLDSVVSKVAGIVSIVGGIEQVTAALNAARQKAEEAAKFTSSTEKPFGSFSQFANAAEVERAAKKTYAEGGAGSIAEASQIAYSLNSSGLLEDRRFFSQLYSTGLDVSKTVEGAGALTYSMGRAEVGSSREVLSKAIAAAGPIAGDPQDILKGAARTGGVAKTLGMHDEELMAAIQLATKQAGDPDRASTNVSQMLSHMVDLGYSGPEWKGKSLADKLESYRALGKSDPEIMKDFGQEGFRAYAAMDPASLRGATSEIGAAGTRFADETIARAFSSPSAMKSRMLRATQAQIELENTALGDRENLEEAYLRRTAQNEGPVRAFFNDKLDRGRRMFGDDILRGIEDPNGARAQYRGRSGAPEEYQGLAALRDRNDESMKDARTITDDPEVKQTLKEIARGINQLVSKPSGARVYVGGDPADIPGGPN